MTDDDDPDEALALRPTVIGGERAPDDYQVIWRNMPIGRIMRQRGAPPGRPDWFFGANLYGKPQPPGDRGIASSLNEAKARFKETWKRIRADLAYEDIATARRHFGV